MPAKRTTPGELRAIERDAKRLAAAIRRVEKLREELHESMRFAMDKTAGGPGLGARRVAKAAGMSVSSAQRIRDGKQ